MLGKLSVLLLAAVGLTPPVALGLTVSVSADTSAISGGSAVLAFDFINGDGVVNNSATITGFTTDGTLTGGTSVGGVTGSLPGTVALNDTAFFNERLEHLTLGTSIQFSLDLTSNFAGGVPDSFSLFLLDPISLQPILATDLPGNTLAEIDIDGSPRGTVRSAASTTPNVPIVVTVVPEPNTVLLMLAVLIPVAWLTRNRRYWS